MDDSTLYNTNVSSPTTDAGKPIRPLVCLDKVFEVIRACN